MGTFIFCSSIVILIALILLYLNRVIFRSIEYKYKTALLWFSDEYRKPIMDKFWSYLDNIRKQENIYLEMFDTIEELNPNTAREEYAGGLYEYLKPEADTQEKRDKYKLPKIKLHKKSTALTYAHELGHHFALKERGDRSEELSDTYIMNSALSCLTKFEIVIIGISLEIHSGVKLPFNHEEEFDKFADMEKIKYRREEINRLKRKLFDWFTILAKV